MSAPAENHYDLPALHAALEKNGLIVAGAELLLIRYEDSFPRRPAFQRWHFRVEHRGQPVCHLIVGRNLARIYAQANSFHLACPELICRPLLFWEQANGIGHLCLEHFTGESLDEAVQKGHCTAAQWLEQVRRAQKLLDQTKRPSNRTELEREIDELVEEACNFPSFTRFDVQLIREQIRPCLLTEASIVPLATRWSNGDFIGRNLLINAHGEIRLIDYEHAAPTHFWNSDWLRLTQYSQLPSGIVPASFEESSLTQPQRQEIHFWLYNLSQLKQAESCAEVDHHIGSVVRQLFRALNRAASSRPSPLQNSFLLATLTAKSEDTNEVDVARKAEARKEQKLQAELEQARHLLLTMNRESVAQRTSIRTVQGEWAECRLQKTTLAAEVTRLSGQLEQIQRRIDDLLRENETPAPLENPPGSQIKYVIDQGGSLRALCGKLNLTGWIAGATNGSQQARLRLDSEHLFDAQTGLSRPDIKSIHPDLIGAATSGFALQTYLPPGLHLVTLEHRINASDEWKSIGRFSVIAEVSPLIVRLEIPIIASGPAGLRHIRGWCFHPQDEILSLLCSFGPTQTPLTHGITRSDVGLIHPWNMSARKSGFDGQLEFIPGKGDVLLTATLRSGSVLQQILAQSITIPDLVLEQSNPTLGLPSSHLPDNVAYLCPLNVPLHFSNPDTVGSYLTKGWSEPESNFRWAISAQAGLRARFASAEWPSHVKLLLTPLLIDGQVERQRITLSFSENTHLSTVELKNSQPTEIKFDLPEKDPFSDILTLQFNFPDACRPRDIGLSSDNRLLSVAFFQLTFA